MDTPLAKPPSLFTPLVGIHDHFKGEGGGGLLVFTKKWVRVEFFFENSTVKLDKSVNRN